jgi:prepilin-type N-terminal cleavage/methylation domain-containing protein
MNVPTKKDNQKGFTIIEVVLVLAIAGLIFLMVFIALPALQRNQRDTQRRNDLSRVQSAIQNYQTNNRNSLPTFDGNFISQYLTVTNSGGSSADKFTDPNGNDYSFKEGGTVNDTFDTTQSVIYVTKGAICGDNNSVTSGQGQSKVALQYKLEGGGVACVNN